MTLAYRIAGRISPQDLTRIDTGSHFARCIIDEFDLRPDFVPVDSGGHPGHAVLRYVLDNVRGPCVTALEYIHPVKHFASFRDVRADDRFDLLVASEEKFGFCIARFQP